MIDIKEAKLIINREDACSLAGALKRDLQDCIRKHYAHLQGENSYSHSVGIFKRQESRKIEMLEQLSFVAYGFVNNNLRQDLFDLLQELINKREKEQSDEK
jgi:hypothetical protein